MTTAPRINQLLFSRRLQLLRAALTPKPRRPRLLPVPLVRGTGYLNLALRSRWARHFPEPK